MRMISMNMNTNCWLKVKKGLMKQNKRKPRMSAAIADAFITQFCYKILWNELNFLVKMG